MKGLLVLLISSFAFGLRVQAQSLSVTFSINTEQDTLRISPYIYRSNGQGDDTSAHITARRAGGNRWTGYNWENNASNAGTDYLNHSDDYMTSQLPASVRNQPAAAAVAFHNDSRALGAYSLVTLPAAGYVAADIDGTVDASETAPSKRWKAVVFSKGAAFSEPPDGTDGFVYDDEEVNHLVKTLGSSTAGGIEGYDCDNEPALWPNTHPRIHPQATTCAEVIARDSAVGQAVKSVDPNAQVFGPVSYGFAEFLNNQSAPDWGSYQSYGRCTDAYLANMARASTAAGKRLLDVLDLHWYPEAQGIDSNGTLTRITFNNSASRGMRRARIDAPRSLWDSSYTENSWIGQYYSPVALLPWLNSAIKQYYPGTKLAITELNYGGEQDISGAIAMADVLGIFGTYGVYMSNYWGTVTGFVASAYRMYRNYDGSGASFGDIGVQAKTTNIDSTSVYAAKRSSDPDVLDIIAINKSLIASANATFAVSSPTHYSTFDAFELHSDASAIRKTTSAGIVGNSLTLTLAPLTITHLVLRSQSSVASSEAPASLAIRSATSLGRTISVELGGQPESQFEVRLVDLLGRQRTTLSLQPLRNFSIDVPGVPTGFYFLIVQCGSRVAIQKLMIR